MLAAALAALAAMTAVTVTVVTLAASVVQASHSLGRCTTRPRSPGPCLAPPAPDMLSSQSASPREELALLPHSLSCRCELWPLGAGRHSNCSGRSTHSIQCRRRSSRPCPQCRASRRSGQGQIRGRRLSSSRRACRPARGGPDRSEGGAGVRQARTADRVWGTPAPRATALPQAEKPSPPVTLVLRQSRPLQHLVQSCCRAT